MPRFLYEAADINSHVVKGTAEVDDPTMLAERLQDKGLFVLSISEEREKFENIGFLGPVFDYVNRIKHTMDRVRPDLIVLFNSQLSVMSGSGLRLVKSLSSLAADTENRKFKKILEDIKQDVEQGASFSEALSRYNNVFGPLYIHLVKAGEASGELDVILSQLATYLEKTTTLRRKVKGALIYPAIIVSFAILAVFVLMWKVVPIFTRFYDRAGAPLPWPTHLLTIMSNAIKEYFFLFPLIIGGIGFAFWAAGRTTKGRWIIDNLKLKIPVFGLLIRKVIIARFSRTLAVLVGSGVSILEALSLVAKASGNKVMEEATEECIIRIENGASLSEALGNTGVFPEMVRRMVATGEESGNLATMLRKVADYYEQQVETAVNTLSSSIEPLLILFVGGVVGFIIIAMFYPIFKLGQTIRMH
jgi:type IV pilus assembly protein PilC